MSLSTDPIYSPIYCPICGELNQCTMANNQTEQPCWCVDVSVPQSLIDTLPDPEIGKRCICKACIEAHKKA